VTVTDTAVTARLHEGGGGAVLWIVNPARQPKTVTAAVDGGAWSSGRDLWAAALTQVSGSTVRVTVGARDAAVIRLAH